MTTFTIRRRNRLGLKLALGALAGIAIFAIFTKAHGAPAEAARSENADLYAAGQISVTPFASYRVHEFESLDGEAGVGLGLGYALTRNLTLHGWALSEEYTDEPVIDSITSAGAGLKFYAPIKNSGFAPYAVLGYSREIAAQVDNMETGAGLEQRFKVGKLKGAAFIEGVWVQNFGTTDPVSYAHARFSAGVGFQFGGK